MSITAAMIGSAMSITTTVMMRNAMSTTTAHDEECHEHHHHDHDENAMKHHHSHDENAMGITTTSTMRNAQTSAAMTRMPWGIITMMAAVMSITIIMQTKEVFTSWGMALFSDPCRQLRYSETSLFHQGSLGDVLKGPKILPQKRIPVEWLYLIWCRSSMKSARSRPDYTGKVTSVIGASEEEKS